MPSSRLILGSQSQQRRHLLESIVAPNMVSVLPPASDDEPGFEGLQTTNEIEERLQRIVRLKTDDVSRQLAALPSSSSGSASDSATLICADTIVVCQSSDGGRVVLGKPPLRQWQETVRHWFQTYYSGQIHEVWTGFQVTFKQQSEFQIVKAKVAFPTISEQWIDWYLATKEPVGKAGGYGIQGHAAAFVTSIQGSLTTIIGLPVWELKECLVQHKRL